MIGTNKKKKGCGQLLHLLKHSSEKKEHFKPTVNRSMNRISYLIITSTFLSCSFALQSFQLFEYFLFLCPMCLTTSYSLSVLYPSFFSPTSESVSLTLISPPFYSCFHCCHSVLHPPFISHLLNSISPNLSLAYSNPFHSFSLYLEHKQFYHIQ